MRITLLFLAILLAACSQKPSSETVSGADSVGTAPPQETIRMHAFENDKFLSKPLAIDVNDTTSMKAMFPTFFADGSGADLEGGNPWYRFYTLSNEVLALSYYDFYDNEPQRIYFDAISTSDPSVQFSQAVKVGMTKADFLKTFNQSGESAETAERFVVMSKDHNGTFVFENDVLKSVSLAYSYGEGFPRTLYSFADDWESITENEGEGMVEQFQECNPHTYSLTTTIVEVNGQEVEKQILNLGMVQDSRTDTVVWIRRSPEGIVIKALNSYDSYKPYVMRITMKDENWVTAEWDRMLVAPKNIADMLMSFPCNGGEEQ